MNFSLAQHFIKTESIYNSTIAVDLFQRGDNSSTADQGKTQSDEANTEPLISMHSCTQKYLRTYCDKNTEVLVCESDLCEERDETKRNETKRNEMKQYETKWVQFK